MFSHQHCARRVVRPASTNHGFDEVTLATVARWRFRPGTRAGRAVNVRMRVPIAFSLRDGLDAEI